MYTVDVETCGFHGPIVLLQYALDDGPVQLHCPWTEPIKDTIELIETLVNHPGGLLFFNAAFDWFHLCQMYTTLLWMPDREDRLEEWTDLYAESEAFGRDGPCLKPVTCCDVFLHARKGPYQSTMDRKNIRIKKVPTSLASPLAKELEKRIPLKDIYFARRKDKHLPKWQIVDIKDSFDEYDPEFKNIEVRFKPSSALKALAVDMGIVSTDRVIKYANVSPRYNPVELGYAPFATAIGRRGQWNGAWPDVIDSHILHWGYNEQARTYAQDDVLYTREVWKRMGSPEFGDDDSVLACSVAACRWKGFSVNIEGLKALKKKVSERRYKDFEGQKYKIPTAPKDVKRYVLEQLSHVEQVAIEAASKVTLNATKRTLLEAIEKFTEVCPVCKGIKSDDTICEKCNGRGEVKHVAALRAKEVLDARKTNKELELYDKLIKAGRFHASFKVIGSLSGRMSGTDKLNALAVKKSNEVRSQFTLSFDGEETAGGDFESFEITIAEGIYKDPQLRKDLLTCENCDGEMVRVATRTQLTNFLTPDGVDRYIQFRLKQEAANEKKALKRGTKYTPVKNFDQESLEDDFYCTSCGSNEGKKLHALFGTFVFRDMTYEQIKATDGDPINDIYTKCKQAVFAMLYGGEGPTLHDRLGVPLEIAEEAFMMFLRFYKQVGVERKKVVQQFQSMVQPDGIGTKVEWHEPAEKISTLYGFNRFFTLENMICKTLFELAENPPPVWNDLKVKVTRRDRSQFPCGAVRSAVFAAAFNVQGQNTRAAVNHVIQGTGAQITKKVQRRVWDIQPAGVNPWVVRPMNCHDQVMVPHNPAYTEQIAATVKATVAEFRELIPLIKLPWKSGLTDWADKKGK